MTNAVRARPEPGEPVIVGPAPQDRIAPALPPITRREFVLETSYSFRTARIQKDSLPASHSLDQIAYPRARRLRFFRRAYPSRNLV
jgi:hypothetical protein